MKTISIHLSSEYKSGLFAFLKALIAISIVILAWKYIGVAFAVVLGVYVLIMFLLQGLSRIRKQQQKIDNELLNHNFGNNRKNV